MTHEDAGIEPHDVAAVTAFEDALHDFTEELNRLHIVHGAPTYATVAGASSRPRLTKAGLNELLSGKRFTSLEALLEFVRVVTTPRHLDPAAAAGFRAAPATVDEWRRRWQEVKLLQRRAQPANKRLRATVRQTLDDASQEAEALRRDARAEADRIRAGAEAEAAQLRARARREYDELLHRARQEAARAEGAPPGEGAGEGGDTLDTREAAAAGSGSGSGSGARTRWRGRSRGLLAAARPPAAATAVAGLVLAAMVAGDSFTGTSGDCRAGLTRAADQLIPRAGPTARDGMRLAAFAHGPGSFIPGPPGPVRGFPLPSSGPSADASPAPSTSPTPSPAPAPTVSPTTTTTPTAPSRPDPCAPQARGGQAAAPRRRLTRSSG
ncbi:hypothetical protein ACWGE1_36285 [Streptomyces sp. NPDC054932]